MTPLRSWEVWIILVWKQRICVHEVKVLLILHRLLPVFSSWWLLQQDSDDWGRYRVESRSLDRHIWSDKGRMIEERSKDIGRWVKNNSNGTQWFENNMWGMEMRNTMNTNIFRLTYVQRQHISDISLWMKSARYTRLQVTDYRLKGEQRHINSTLRKVLETRMSEIFYNSLVWGGMI